MFVTITGQVREVGPNALYFPFCPNVLHTMLCILWLSYGQRYHCALYCLLNCTILYPIAGLSYDEKPAVLTLVCFAIYWLGLSNHKIKKTKCITAVRLKKFLFMKNIRAFARIFSNPLQNHKSLTLRLLLK